MEFSISYGIIVWTDYQQYWPTLVQPYSYSELTSLCRWL